MSVEPVNPMLIVNQKPLGFAPQQDPRPMYKAGCESVMVHAIDSQGWLNNGWSYEPVAEQVNCPMPEPKAKSRKKAEVETDDEQPV